MGRTEEIARSVRRELVAAGALLALFGGAAGGQGRGQPWARHAIDNSSRGADGVRLADINADGLEDITTGWEEGGLVRVYVNPGAQRAKEPWPAVTVGKVRSPEDAVFADVDGDGATDVVSCCEGRTMAVFVHWSPKDGKRLLDPAAWKTQAFGAAKGVSRWMFCLPMQVDGKHGVDLIVGSKNPNGQVAWLEAPADPRDLAAWKRHLLCPAGWIMSLIGADMDADGDLDVVVTDRKGRQRGCYWLDNPGPRGDQTKPWARREIGGAGREVMFAALADVDADGRQDVVVATKPDKLLLLLRKDKSGRKWQERAATKPENMGTLKAAGVGDLNGDGAADIVLSCENAKDGRSGVVWLSRRGRAARAGREKAEARGGADGGWRDHEISGPAGVKYDLVELRDLDADGDLDVLTCEERANLGVIWYENPRRPAAGQGRQENVPRRP